MREERCGTWNRSHVLAPITSHHRGPHHAMSDSSRCSADVWCPSVALAQEVIDWHAAEGCFSDLDRREFLSLLPAHTRNSMPEEGAVVLYYGDGHQQSVTAEVSSARFRLSLRLDRSPTVRTT